MVPELLAASADSERSSIPFEAAAPSVAVKVTIHSHFRPGSDVRGQLSLLNYRQQVNAQGRIYSLLRKYLSWNDGGLLNVRRIVIAETVSAGTNMGDVE